jgi:quercetin 2,3-dioxygenase
LEVHNALWINQQAVLSQTKLTAGNSISYQNSFTGNGVFLVNISGQATVNDIVLHKRDALGIAQADSFTITAVADTELLAIEIPMQ